MLWIVRIYVVFIFTMVVSNNSLAQAIAPLKVSIPEMPVHAENNEQGVLVNFTKALAHQLNRDVKIAVVPFALSMEYVKSGKVDFHLPLIKSTVVDKPPFYYSDATIFHVNFVLYLHKDIDFKAQDIAKLTIETDKAHQAYFPFKTKASACILCSLKRVQFGFIDGYLFADSSTDPLLLTHRQQLTNVVRRLYKSYEVKIIFPKSAHGQSLNKQVSAAVEKMRQSGQLTELLFTVDQPFDQTL